MEQMQKTNELHALEASKSLLTMRALDGNKPVPQNCKMCINLQGNQKHLKRGNVNVWAHMDTLDMLAAHSTLMP